MLEKQQQASASASKARKNGPPKKKRTPEGGGLPENWNKEKKIKLNYTLVWSSEWRVWVVICIESGSMYTGI